MDEERYENDKTAIDKEVGARSRPWVKFRRHRMAMFGAIVLILLIASAVFAPFIVSYDPNEINLRSRYSPPSKEHWLGTDRVGRDNLSRLIYGGRVSLLVGLGGVSIATFIGVTLGGISGFVGGRLDAIMLKLSEIIMCFPSIVLILVLVAIIGQSLVNIVLIFGFTQWVGMYRLVRSLFYTIREEDFVESLRAFGISKYSIIFRHILPNAFGPVAVLMTLSLAGMILQEAGLSFLGLGVPTPTPSWGNILQSAQELTILRERPWLWLPPGLMVSMAVLAVNFLGDGLRDVFDPYQQS